MRRKIALLLAFAMVLSILPMNVFASGPLGAGVLTRTGMLAEINPAQSVRHWDPGVAVGRQWVVDRMYPASPTGITAAPQGNLRHIVADAAYFAMRQGGGPGGPERANLTMDINNVSRWLGWQQFPSNPSWSPAVGIHAGLPTNQGGVNIFSTTSPPVLSPQLPGNWHTNPGQVLVSDTRITSTTRTNFERWVHATIAANGNMASQATTELMGGINNMGIFNPGAQVDFINTFFTDFSNPSRVSISVRMAPPSLSLPNPTITFAAGIFTQTATRARLDLWRPFSGPIGSLPTNLINWRNTATVANPLTLSEQEAIMGFMSSQDNWVQLPIEYITNGDTNDDPVFLNFFENSGWPQAGQVRPGGGIPGRTDITAVTERRFSFDKGAGDRRTFHRYQRGILPSIRIAEAAQGAFDDQFWWIELTIEQTGFFFTEDSLTDVRFSTRWGGPAPSASTAWGGNGIATGTPPNTSFVTGVAPNQVTRTPLGWWDGWRPATTNPTRDPSQIGMLRIEDGPVRREPVDGPNRYTRLVFGVQLPGVTRPGRVVNDWLDINYLSIAADDRARDGKVEIKVDLYRANPVASPDAIGGFQGTVPGLTGWNWVPSGVGPASPPGLAPPNGSYVATPIPPFDTTPITGTDTIGWSGGWYGMHPSLNINNDGGTPPAIGTSQLINIAQAQSRGENVFIYQRIPLRYERFDPSLQSHLDDRASFVYLPKRLGIDANNAVLRDEFRWGGAPTVTGIINGDDFAIPNNDTIAWAESTAGIAGNPFFNTGVRTLATMTEAQRGNFWRLVPATARTPRYFAYAAQTEPTGGNMTSMQNTFNAAITQATGTFLPALRRTDVINATTALPNTLTPAAVWELFADISAPEWALAGTLQWQQQTQPITLLPIGGTRTFERGAHVADGIVEVGTFGSLGLEFEIHPDDSAEDFWLLSGRRDWQFSREVTGDGRRPIGVVEQILDNTNHLTARARLRELSAGALAATGANPVTFEFNEGIQILGARIWTNNANFVPANRFNDKDDTVLFGDRLNVADSFLGAVIDRNVLTLRPEIGTPSAQEQRWRLAQITVQFYLSVMPGYVYEFLDDAIEVTVTASDASDLATPFTKSVPIAFAVDPITVETDVATVGAISPAEFGSLHVIPINDIVITEVDSRNLEVGTRLWVGVEGGISRGFGAADHISLTAGSVEVDPPGSIGIGPLRSDTHGAYVEITRVSNVNTNGAQIIFRDVKVSGRVFSETEYNIIVAGNSVAANWEEYLWLDGDMPTGIARGGIHGFFHEEPYMTPGFVFAGDDIAIVELPAPAPPAPAPAPAPAPPASMGPVTLTQNVAFTRPNGDQVFPPFEMVRIPANSESATAFVSVRVVADILGWELDWDETARRATFTMLSGQTVAFTFDQTTADVNGVATPMLTASPAPGVPGSPVAARVTNDGRLMVPIRFFRELGVNVQWVQNAPTPQIVVHQGPLTP